MPSQDVQPPDALTAAVAVAVKGWCDTYALNPALAVDEAQYVFDQFHAPPPPFPRLIGHAHLMVAKIVRWCKAQP